MTETVAGQLLASIFTILKAIVPVILLIVLCNPKLKAKYLPQRTWKEGVIITLILIVIALFVSWILADLYMRGII